MTELLRVTNLTVSYKKAVVLRDVEMHVDEGEVVAVIGPHEAGKSSLLKAIVGLVRPAAGSVKFAGAEIAGLPAYAVARKGISYVPEGGAPFANMTVRQNLEMGAYARREQMKAGILEDIYRLFPILKEQERTHARDLSSSQKRMLAIGRGLALDPRLLMLDEPSLGLNPKLIEDIYSRLQKLKGWGLTVLLAEQGAAHVLQLADRCYVLEEGAVVLQGRGSELANSAYIQKHYRD